MPLHRRTGEHLSRWRQLGSFVVVIPEEEFVVVRLGLTRNESQANTNWLLANLLERIP